MKKNKEGPSIPEDGCDEQGQEETTPSKKISTDFPAMLFEASMARVEDLRQRIIALHWLCKYFNDRNYTWRGEKGSTKKAQQAFEALHDYFFGELAQAYESLLGTAVFSDNGEIIKNVRKEAYEKYLMEGKALASFFQWDDLPAREIYEHYEFCGLSEKHGSLWISPEKEKELNEYLQSLYKEAEREKADDPEKEEAKELLDWSEDVRPSLLRILYSREQQEYEYNYCGNGCGWF